MARVSLKGSQISPTGRAEEGEVGVVGVVLEFQGHAKCEGEHFLQGLLLLPKVALSLCSFFLLKFHLLDWAQEGAMTC